MPIYEFEHVIRLATSQKTALAKAITNWHATKFKAPRFIVTCRFVDVSQGPLSETYIGGEPRKINSLFVSLRSGIWSDIVGSTKEAQLRAVYLKGNLDSALEAGVMLPMPGKFEQRVKENTEKFKKLAASGDEDFIGLMKEIETRPEFQQ